MNDPGQQKLWSIPGNGVLARQGSLVLLTSIDDHEFAESLLNELARTSADGGDGRALGDAIGAQVEAHQSWGGLDGGPTVVAFGPAGNGMAFTVLGTASVQFSTSHAAEQQLTADHPSMLLRSTVGVPVRSIRATLDRGETGNGTDRFTRLDSGTVRAGGLSYYAGHPAAKEAPAAEEAPAAPVIPDASDTPSRPEPPSPTGPVPYEPTPVPYEPRPLPDEPAPAPSRPSSQQVDPDTLPPQSTLPTTPPTPTKPTPFDPAKYGASQSPFGAESGFVVSGPSSVPPVPYTQVDMAPSPAPGPAPAGTGDNGAPAPIVLGVHCKNGHFTDPNARSCLTCGTAIKKRSAAQQPGPRPPLGTLVFDDGETLAVDRDYVIGRSPARDQAVESGAARPLRVVDDKGMVSRVHARIHLDGWQVLLGDLGSANGTHVQPPGAPEPRRLEPQVPVELHPGTLFYVGSACLRFEAAR